MSRIQVTNLTFAYEGSYDNIFEQASFQIDTDWKLGFIGRNGRGKTTFLQLLLGKHAYQGSISASVEFAYFPFPVEDETRDTLEVVDAMNPAYEFWELLREFSYLELDAEVLYRPFDTLSRGEQTKVMLAALFLRENHFLLIDEPTNHLDAQGRRLVSQYLNRQKGFILVSHDRSFLDGCIDHVLSINKQNIEVQKGNFSSWYENKQRQDAFELSEHEKLQKEVGRLKQAAKRTGSWSEQVEKTKFGVKTGGLRPDRGFIGHKAAKMMKRSKVIESRQQEAIAEKEKLLQNLETMEELQLRPLSYHTDLLLSMKDATVRYGEKTVCEGVNLEIRQGECVQLKGKNGCGKSTLLKLILGEVTADAGEIRTGSGLKISYVSQDTRHLKGSLSAYARDCGIEEHLLKALLRKLDFSRVQFEKNMEDYSEGQKKKVLLARSLCERAHLYLWDEPLNYIDLFSRMQLEELLKAYHPAMLFVEHDESFSSGIADRIVEL